MEHHAIQDADQTQRDRVTEREERPVEHAAVHVVACWFIVLRPRQFLTKISNPNSDSAHFYFIMFKS